MRILIVSNSIGLYRGGHGKNIFHLAVELKKLNVDVDVFTYLLHDQNLERFGVDIYRSKLNKYNLRAFSKEISSFIQKRDYDIIHSNGAVNYYYFRNINNVPTVFHARSHNFSNFKALLFDKYSYLQFKLIKNIFGSLYEYIHDLYYLRRDCVIIANCNDVKERLSKDLLINKHAAQKIHVIHNAIYLHRKDDDLIKKRRIKTYGFLANFFPIKGWDFLVKVIKKTLQNNGEVKFILGGDGHLRKHVEGLLHNEVLLGKVVFLGRLDSEEKKYNFFNSIDCFVCPAHAPTTVTEALSFGLPIIHFKRWFDCADGMDLKDFNDTNSFLEFEDLTPLQASIVLLNGTTKFDNMNFEKIYDVLLNKYSWEKVALSTLYIYNKILVEKS